MDTIIFENESLPIHVGIENISIWMCQLKRQLKTRNLS